MEDILLKHLQLFLVISSGNPQGPCCHVGEGFGLTLPKWDDGSFMNLTTTGYFLTSLITQAAVLCH